MMGRMITSGSDPAAVTPPRPQLSSRLGTAVVQQLVDLIVTGEFKPGDLLPPEAPLAERFGVSRTVIRESVKRLQEKGLVVVGQGRGTQVLDQTSWRMLDAQVLSALVEDDVSSGILSDLSAVRASLEAMMAGAVARSHTDAQLTGLQDILASMQDLMSDETAFYQADVGFHFALMRASGNRLAHNITRALYQRALESPRYLGHNPNDAMHRTLAELDAVYAAISAGDEKQAEQAMRQHIEVGWERRRLTS